MTDKGFSARLAELLAPGINGWAMRTTDRLAQERAEMDVEGFAQDMVSEAEATMTIPAKVLEMAERETRVAIEEMLADARKHAAQTDLHPLDRALDLGVDILDGLMVPGVKSTDLIKVLCSATAFLLMDKLEAETPAKPEPEVDIATALADVADWYDEHRASGDGYLELVALGREPLPDPARV